MLCTLIGAIILSINIQVGLGLNFHLGLYDDIGDTSSTLQGLTSSFNLWWSCDSCHIAYHSKCFSECIPKSIPSVCTTIFKRLACLCLFLNLWCYTTMDSSRRALQTKGRHLLNFKFVSKLLDENRKIFKRKVKREYWSKCNVLYINWFVSNPLIYNIVSRTYNFFQ